MVVGGHRRLQAFVVLRLISALVGRDNEGVNQLLSLLALDVRWRVERSDELIGIAAGFCVEFRVV